MTDFPLLEDAGYEASTKHYDSDSQLRQHATSDSWRGSTRLDKARQLRKALAHQRRLETAARNLELCVSNQSNHPYTGDLISSLARDIVASAAGLQQFLSHLSSTRLFNERRPAAPSAPRKVFDIPELLERILSYVDARDLLQVQRVDKTMYHAVDQSSILQRALHLRPSPVGHLSTLFTETPRPPSRKPSRFKSPRRFPGFSCRHYAQPWSFDGTGSIETPNKMSVCAKFMDSEPQAMGSRCRKMLICDPPVHELDIYPSCCSINPHDVGACSNHYTFTHGPQPPAPLIPGLTTRASVAGAEALIPPLEKVTSPTGLTVGDLYDAALKTRKAHMMCPFASPWAHNDEGQVEPFISFGGDMTLKPDDPQHPSKDPVTNTFGLMPMVAPPMDHILDAQVRRDQQMQRYIDAKQRALVNGEPIPSFEAFKTQDVEPSLT